METGMIVITSVLFAVIIVPTLLIFKNSTKQSKSLLNGLKKVVSEDNGILSRHVEQTNYALGIDETRKTIYFYKRNEDYIVSKTIDLTTVSSCEISTKKRRIRKEKGFIEIIEKIDLLFTSKNNSQVELIELYNEEDSLLTDELKIAENWKEIVHKLVSDKSKFSKQQGKHEFSVSNS